MKRLGECPVDLGPAEAFGELRGASVYEEDPSSAVQPLEPALVSLPEAGSLPKLLAEVCGTGGTEFVETFIEKALAKDTEVERALGEAPPEPYMDENLRARDGDYAHFITRLFGSGMVSYHREAGREQVGFFGVAKKNKKVRLAVDCRRSNAWFSKPAHVELSTGGALSALQVPPGENLYMGHYDIKNAFYTFALPPALNTYFSCPPVKAALLGLRELDGQRVGGQDLIYPRLAILPMGWSHALWWCQVLHCRLLKRVGGSLPPTMIVDRRPTPRFRDEHGHHALQYTVYVDNGIVFGTDKEEVDRLLQRMVAVVSDAGLPVHEVEPASTRVEVLGWCIDGERHQLAPKPHRAWRLRQALEWMLSCKAATSADLEKLVGHCTFLALACRASLSVFSAVYVFITRHRGKPPVPLWPSVRQELVEFQGIIPLIVADLSMRPSDKVFCMDASMSGYGVVSKVWDRGKVEAAQHHSERWRFTKAGERGSSRTASSARESEQSRTSQPLLMGSELAS